MKHWKIILAVLVIVILGDLALTFLLINKAPAPTNNNPGNPFATSTQNTVESPAVFTTNFYKWYLANRKESLAFPASDNLNSLLGPWLTPRFIANWKKIIADTDADPAILSQDDPSNWGPGLGSSIISQSNTASTVKISIGSGLTVYTYIVRLIKIDGNWRIDSVAGS
ncbi:DUF3828 domain-containing protein [Patescibacteria group bacterium]|nr:DUF3828 domain-containing protein [Patescibacteria group bacterium]